jgi:uncharacterized membrane protein
MTKRMVIAVLALGGVFVSAYLTLYKLGYIGQLSCSMGSCETVQMSKWATFLGLPVAAWGIGYYIAVLATAIAGTLPRFTESRRLSTVLLVLSALGFVFTTYLTSLEAFVIHAYCIYCLGSAVIVTLILIASFLDYRELRPLDSTTAGLGRVVQP